MRYKTLFRVLLKAIGVLLIAFTVPKLTDQGLLILHALNVGGTDEWLEVYFYPVIYGGTSAAGAMLQLLLGLYLFFGGKWVTNLAIPDNRSYCPACGYQLTGRDGATCPHCGAATGDAVTSGTL